MRGAGGGAGAQAGGRVQEALGEISYCGTVVLWSCGLDTTLYLTVTAGDVEEIWKIGQSCSPLGSIRLVLSNHVFISLN